MGNIGTRGKGENKGSSPKNSAPRSEGGGNKNRLCSKTCGENEMYPCLRLIQSGLWCVIRQSQQQRWPSKDLAARPQSKEIRQGKCFFFSLSSSGKGRQVQTNERVLKSFPLSSYKATVKELKPSKNGGRGGSLRTFAQVAKAQHYISPLLRVINIHA